MNKIEKLKCYLSIIFFAFFGGISRYYLGKCWHSNGTLIANLTGCFLLSLLTYYIIEKEFLSNWINIGLGTGFIGAYTTFSSFTMDFVKLINTQQIIHAILYLSISIIGGFICVVLGYLLAVKLGKKATK